MASNFDESIPDMAADPAGVAHALNLLLLALAKTNPAVGILLDEFTSMHTEYLARLQALAKDSDARLESLKHFTTSAKLIYKRLSALDAEQASALRDAQHPVTSSLSLH